MATGQLPRANLFDVPELLPGASAGANPAQRTTFENRCRKLREEQAEEEQPYRTGVASSNGATTVEDLCAMFPSLDADLVRSLAMDFPTPQHAIETLLQLVASSSEATVPPLPPRELPIADLEAFPSLTDSDGWQVVSQAQFDKDPDEDLGSAWRDTAKDAADKPAPPKSSNTAPTAWGPKRRAAKEKQEDAPEAALPETDYEQRLRRGQQRAKNKAVFGRGGRSGGRVHSGYGGDNAAETSEESDDEEEEHA